MFVKKAAHIILLGRRQVQTHFGPPPQHIFGIHRPFFGPQITDFAFGQAGAKMLATISQTLGIAQKRRGRKG